MPAGGSEEPGIDGAAPATGDTAADGDGSPATLRAALRPYAGPIVVLLLILAVLVVGLLIAVVGARQPAFVITTSPLPEDSFSRDDSGTLGTTEQLGLTWEEVGEWGVFDTTAMLLTPAPGGAASTATVDIGSEDGRVAARLRGIDGAGGLVFRYQGPDDYVAMLPVPAFGAWAVVTRQDGKDLPPQNVELTETDEGVLAEAIFEGRQLSVVINNKLVKTIELPAGTAGSRVGFISVPAGASRTRFDDLVARPASDP